MDELEATLARPTAASLLDGVLQLGREIHLEMDERTLAAKFHATLAALFSGRLIAIRIETAAGRQVVATAGEVITGEALVGPLVLKPRSLQKTKLDPAVVDAGRVQIAAATPPVFTRARAGFSIPLVAGGDIYGALDVGYTHDPAVADDDEDMLIPIANQLSVALRNFRLHAEARLLRDMLGGLVEHADALIVGVGRDWRITVFNRALARLTGREPSEAVGRDLRQLLPEADGPRLVAYMSDFFAGRTRGSIHIDFPDRTGRQVRTVWNIAAVRDAATGRIDQLVAVGQDRTRLLSLERQIIQAEKLATLGELAAGVVHELGNPLTAITVYADYLMKKVERGPLDGGDAEKLRRILEGAERILNFSRSLVQYAAPAPMESGYVALNDAVRQALFFCEHVLVERGGVDLRVELAESLPAVVGVRGQITQVVINLVTNAVQALPAGGGRLRVATAPPIPGTATLTVEDEGSGIAADDLERIFEPFYTTKSDGKGSGLGLSVVRSIVERHAGKIAVDSVLGRGTIFTVSFPARVLE